MSIEVTGKALAGLRSAHQGAVALANLPDAYPWAHVEELYLRVRAAGAPVQALLGVLGKPDKTATETATAALIAAAFPGVNIATGAVSALTLGQELADLIYGPIVAETYAPSVTVVITSAGDRRGAAPTADGAYLTAIKAKAAEVRDALAPLVSAAA